MNARVSIVAVILAGILGSSFAAQAQMRRFNAKPGTAKIRMEGTSNVHPWQTEGKIIGGYMEVGQNFPTEAGKDAKPGKVEAKVDAFIPVKSMNSVEKDGRPYSVNMDDIMYGKLKAAEFPRITFALDELTLKEVAKSKDQPFIYEATGKLGVAGVTNKVTMPVKITPVGADTLKITGDAKIKMTDFKIEPPAPKIPGLNIVTGDEVKLIFDWTVVEKKAK